MADWSNEQNMPLKCLLLSITSRDQEREEIFYFMCSLSFTGFDAKNTF